MRITLDTAKQSLTVEGEGTDGHEVPLYSPEAFALLGREWLRVGWSLKYYHTFTWLGLPILQLPEDLVRLQEVIWTLRPDVIVETGVYQGGSLLFHAGLFELIGKGRVIGVDIAVTDQTKAALASHSLAHRIDLVTGDSGAPETLQRVKSFLPKGASVMVILDSDHSFRHVTRELELYAPLVTPESYMLVTDGVMKDLTDVPGGHAEWRNDNPTTAARAFAAAHPEFEMAQPAWREAWSPVKESLTYWPDGWLRRKL